LSRARNKAALGTLAWVRATQGILRGRDRWVVLGQACLYGLSTLPAEVRRALGIQPRRLARIDPADLTPPDSAASREAERLVAEATSPMVVNHCYRTYAWGAALAAHDELRYDQEVVFVASLLHDLYFERPRALPHPHCFTLPAAQEAMALTEAAGWDERRRQATADAITLHMNLVPPRDSAEAKVVFVGARLDVVGYRHWDLRAETIASVLQRYPRLDLKEKSCQGFAAQAATNPGSRIHLYKRYLAINWFTRRAPFEE
jgi:hypothetical protein